MVIVSISSVHHRKTTSYRVRRRYKHVKEYMKPHSMIYLWRLRLYMIETAGFSTKTNMVPPPPFLCDGMRRRRYFKKCCIAVSMYSQIIYCLLKSSDTALLWCCVVEFSGCSRMGRNCPAMCATVRANCKSSWPT